MYHLLIHKGSKNSSYRAGLKRPEPNMSEDPLLIILKHYINATASPSCLRNSLRVHSCHGDVVGHWSHIPAEEQAPLFCTPAQNSSDTSETP